MGGRQTSHPRGAPPLAGPAWQGSGRVRRIRRALREVRMPDLATRLATASSHRIHRAALHRTEQCPVTC